VPVAVGVAAAMAGIVFAVYALMSVRAVYGGRWPITVVKAASIGAVYLVASIPALFIMLIWASLV
jgi:hypothetical protein